MAASGSTVRVEGLAELVRTFGRLQPELRRGVQRELSEAARIVGVETQRRLAALSPSASPRTVSGVRPRVTGATAFVEQRLAKKTGKRADWGATQMRLGFLPALDSKQEAVVARLDEMLGRLGGDF